MNLAQHSSLILRFGIFAIFGYFGVLAVLNPGVEAAKWIRPEIYNLINAVVPITWFMTVFGLVQIATALGVLFKVLYRWALLAAGGMLIGIMINLGFSDITLRDFVIFTAVVHLFLSEQK